MGNTFPFFPPLILVFLLTNYKPKQKVINAGAIYFFFFFPSSSLSVEAVLRAVVVVVV
jgi:hypothetical protein